MNEIDAEKGRVMKGSIKKERDKRQGTKTAKSIKKIRGRSEKEKR